MTSTRPFIHAELQRAIAEDVPDPNGAVALRTALRLVEVLVEHPSPAVRAQALEVALYALAHSGSRD